MSRRYLEKYLILAGVKKVPGEVIKWFLHLKIILYPCVCSRVNEISFCVTREVDIFNCGFSIKVILRQWRKDRKFFHHSFLIFTRARVSREPLWFEHSNLFNGGSLGITFTFLLKRDYLINNYLKKTNSVNVSILKLGVLNVEFALKLRIYRFSQHCIQLPYIAGLSLEALICNLII